MNTMKQIKGDLLALAKQGEFDVIVHGCNCMNTMGAGIAKQLREQFPETYEADCRTTSGDRKKLGTYTSAQVGDLTIVNAYTQYNFQRDPPPVDYDAIREVFAKIAVDFKGQRIGYPMIGAGLAGGDWDRISTIIDGELYDEDHTVVIYSPK